MYSTNNFIKTRRTTLIVIILCCDVIVRDCRMLLNNNAMTYRMVINHTKASLCTEYQGIKNTTYKNTETEFPIRKI